MSIEPIYIIYLYRTDNLKKFKSKYILNILKNVKKYIKTKKF